MAARDYPCPNAATQVSAARVAPPLSAAPGLPTDPLPSLALRLRADSAFAPSFPVKSPPLVLRI